jgi:decaprenylphospho-beta-D-ribofuranose 2-oxidase
MVNQAIAHNLVEWGAYAYLFFIVRDAYRQGRTWLATLLFGIVIGFVLECAIVATQDVNQLHYTYTMDHVAGWGDLLDWFGIVDYPPWLHVPLWLGIGWGIILYAATWAASQWPHPFWIRPAIAGALAVSIDLSLDPVAQLIGLWVWHWNGCSAFFAYRYYDIPFDNYVAWFGIVGFYALCVTGAYLAVDKHVKTLRWRRWFASLAPLAGTGAAVLLFTLCRKPVNAAYAMLGESDAGQLGVFAVLFATGVLFLIAALRRTRRDLKPNWTVLGVPLFFHGGCLLLFLVFAPVASQPTLIVVIPMALSFSFFAYAWPALDTIFPHERWRMSRQARYRSAALMAPRLSRGEPRVRVQVAASLEEGTVDSWAQTSELQREQNLYPEAGLAVRAPRNLMWQRLRGGTSSGPRFYRETLRSYGGEEVSATVCAPEDEDQLREVFATVRRNGQRVTLRASGHSFDGQALPSDVCILLDCFTEIEVDGDAGLVRVGSAARWGDILDRTLERGLVPYVMVTSRDITAGGSLSANGLSRFSVTLGREGQHVESLELLQVDGCKVVCRPGEPLFQAVVGGLGYVGAVLRITYRLMRLPEAWNNDLVVETEFEAFDGLQDLPGKLVPAVSECLQERSSTCVAESARAVSATLYLRGRDRGLVATSKYIRPRKLSPSVFHRPDSLGHRALQVAAMCPGLRRIGYGLVFRKVSRTAVDEVRGYTFFEDGNVWLKKVARFLRLEIGIRQQSYFLPAAGLGGEAQEAQEVQTRLTRFLEHADRRLDELKLVPALIDALYLPADPVPGFVLSVTRRSAGFLITFTFEKILSSGFEIEDSFLMEMADVCAALDGRVHLVKNVLAAPGVIKGMYEQDLAEMPLSVPRVLCNEFSDRIGLSEPRVEVP